MSDVHVPGSQTGEWAIARLVEESLNPQRKLIAELMHSDTLTSGDVGRAIGQVTEVAARALRVDRASVWRIAEDGRNRRIECVDLFEAATRRHSSGLVIEEHAAPAYFRALMAERTIAAHDACCDPRTAEFTDTYLKPLRITSMLDAPVFVRGKMVAVVCHEHIGDEPRRWHFWEELIAGTCADFVALVFEAAGWAQAERALRAERDALEQKVAERTADLRTSEEGLRTLLDVTPIALVLTSLKDHRVVFANPRAFTLFEVPKGSPMGFDAGEFWVKPEDRERFLSAAVTGGVEGLEAELRTRNGRPFWGRLSVQRMRWGGDEALLACVDDITPQKRSEAQLRDLATRDVLTGIHNRRALIELGIAELDRARRYGRPMAAAMIDVDHFKRVNDAYGHAAGDEVLRSIVRTTTDLLRASDAMGRWGGEEFVVLLPETSIEAARGVLERVRAQIEHKPRQAGTLELPVTISIGIAEWTGIESLPALVERADRACYAAKHAGRNRVELAVPA
jgi:diguanylate cyclase (GGDEF)-like protein/PAS domain S-box-containing protein